MNVVEEVEYISYKKLDGTPNGKHTTSLYDGLGVCQLKSDTWLVSSTSTCLPTYLSKWIIHCKEVNKIAMKIV